MSEGVGVRNEVGMQFVGGLTGVLGTGERSAVHIRPCEGKGAGRQLSVLWGLVLVARPLHTEWEDGTVQAPLTLLCAWTGL